MLSGNAFLASGIILVVLGGLLAYLRNVPGKVFRFLQRFVIISIDIQEADESFWWVKIWLAEKLKGALSISVFSKKRRPEWQEESNSLEYEESSNKRPSVIFSPAPGNYWFWYYGKLVHIIRDRKEDAKGAGSQIDGIFKPRESFMIRIFSRNLNIARLLIEEARDFALPEDNRIEIRTVSHDYWKLTARIRPRPLESIILDKDISSFIVKDIREFLDSAEWYEKLGVPYRRGYLFHGNPGSGKTSLVLGLATELGLNVNVLSLSSVGMDDARLCDLLGKVDINNVVLIEDIDCAFNKRDAGADRKKADSPGLTFSGLLNALDGIVAQDGRIVFMTTNFPEKLDAALIRPGRVDVRVKIGYASKGQMHRLFLRFYPQVSEELADAFVRDLPEYKISMAAVQGHLMQYRKSPAQAVENAFLLEKK